MSKSRGCDDGAGPSLEGAARQGRPTANAFRATNSLRGFFLDKIRNVRYIFPLTESLSCSPKDGREDGKPWQFETLVYNLPREPWRGRDFLFFSLVIH
jgi:hypothetical protein